MPAPLKPMLTTKEVGALLRVSRSTVERLRRSGHLVGVSIGVGVRYPQEAVEDLIRRGTDPAADDPWPPSAASTGTGPEARPSAFRVR